MILFIYMYKNSNILYSNSIILYKSSIKVFILLLYLNVQNTNMKVLVIFD